MHEDLIRALAKSGFDTDAGTVEKIAKLGDLAFPHLARLAASGQDGNGARGAVHLLAMLGHYRAQLAINSYLLWLDEDEDDDSDWITEDLPGVLAHMGPGAVMTISGLVRHAAAPEWLRVSAARALASIAIDHPGTKPGIVRTVKEEVRKEQDVGTRTQLAESLLDLVDPDLYEYHENLLLSGAISDDFSGKEVLDAMYSGEMEPQEADPVSPMRMFELRRPPGRNDPCPCGSGKKYKKCCIGR